MIKGDAIWERLKERTESKVNKSVYSLVLADDVVVIHLESLHLA